MKKILNKKLDEKAMLAGIFAFVSLGVLYLFVSATVNNTQAPTVDLSKIAPTTTQTTQSSGATTNGMKKYRSNRLKVEFEYPSNYVIDEKITTIVLKNIQSTDEIIFSKYGTNFESVKDHVDDVIKKKIIKSSERQILVGNNLSGEIITYAESNNVRQTIYFVKNYNVAHFSSTNPSLFPDLEIIAKSFKILE